MQVAHQPLTPQWVGHSNMARCCMLALHATPGLQLRLLTGWPLFVFGSHPCRT